jgi:hypothetical protein
MNSTISLGRFSDWVLLLQKKNDNLTDILFSVLYMMDCWERIIFNIVLAWCDTMCISNVSTSDSDDSHSSDAVYSSLLFSLCTSTSMLPSRSSFFQSCFSVSFAAALRSLHESMSFGSPRIARDHFRETVARDSPDHVRYKPNFTANMPVDAREYALHTRFGGSRLMRDSTTSALRTHFAAPIRIGSTGLGREQTEAKATVSAAAAAAAAAGFIMFLLLLCPLHQF